MRPLFIALASIALILAACGGDTERKANQLAYIDGDGSIVLVNADGSDARKLGDVERCGRFPSLIWSPTGHRLACVGRGTDREGFVVLMNAEGETIAVLDLPGIVSLHWSPSGEAFAFTVDDRLFLADDSGQSLAELGPADLSPAHKAQAYSGFALWSPDGDEFAYRPPDAAEMRIYSLDSAGEQPLPGDYRPLGWVVGGKALLVAARYQPPVGLSYPDYEVNLLEMRTGDFTRLPDLDNGRQLWISPDGMIAAVLTARAGGLPALAMLDFQSGQLLPIPESVISFPSEYIPGGHLTFTPHGTQLYWIAVLDTGSVIYKANSDSTGLTKVAELEIRGARFSPDLTMIAYQTSKDDSVSLYTANIDGTGAREIDEAPIGAEGFALAAAWRPTP